MKSQVINQNSPKKFCFTQNIPFSDSEEEYYGSNEYSLDEAENLLMDLLFDEPDNLEALSNLFIIELLKNRFSEAFEILGHILKIDPKNRFASENIKMMLKLSA